MAHYVLIEGNSGYVWEETDADNAIDACRIIDAKIDREADDYEEVSRSEWNVGNGYFVHLAPADWVPVADGTDPAEIQRVEALPLVCKVKTTFYSDY